MRRTALGVLAAFWVGLSGASGAADGEIANWAAPPYWLPPVGPQGESAVAPTERSAEGRTALAAGPTALPFIALFPCRLVDTRAPLFPAPLGGGFLPAATVRSYTLAGVCNVPANAQAISLNVTVVNPTGPGFITLWPEGGAFPPVSTLNFLGHDVIVNAAVVPLSVSGGISIALGVSGGDVILDTNGYYAAVPSVTSLNALTGDVTLSAGTNVTLTPSGNTLTISASGGGGGGGTVTSVGSGAGLTGGPVTTTGTLSVAPLGITTGMLANNAVTSSKLAAGAVGLGQIDTTQVQARVTTVCPLGETLLSINADGTTVCSAPFPIAPSISTLDGPGDVGSYPAIKIGADGLGLVTYFDTTNGVLKVAHCSNAACTSATISTIDNPGAGGDSSVTIGTDGLGLIAYRWVTSLKVAHCTNAACTITTTSTLDSAAAVGYQNSIAIGADGLGLISYYDVTNGDLKVAHCANTACTSAAISTLDSAGNVGLFTSLAIGADGLGLISYLDQTNLDLKVAHCTNTACTSATVSTLDSAGTVGYESSVAIGTDGLGLISYADFTNTHLKVAHCANVTCTSAATYTIDSNGVVGQSTSIAIGRDGLGVISYFDNSNKSLKVAHCANVPCSSASTFTLDSFGSVGWYTSIAVGSDGLALVAYYDFTNGDLKVARTGSSASSVNDVTGSVTITGGGGTTVTTSGNTLTVTAPPAWGLTGNAGTTPGTNFLGTTDGQPLSIRATGGVGVNTAGPVGDLQVGSGSDPSAFRFGNSADRHHLISNRDMVFNAYTSSVSGAPLFLWRRNPAKFDESGWTQLMALSDNGNLSVTGSLSKGGGSFKIDHPLDPENKFLYHSFVESPDMKNIYDGVVTTDDRGYATVELPAWFEALNRDFRYQLTVLDEADGEVFVHAKVVHGVAANRFTLRTSSPNARVSWQVTGIRRDAWAEKNRIPVEEMKPAGQRGTYLHPEAFEKAAPSPAEGTP